VLQPSLPNIRVPLCDVRIHVTFLLFHVPKNMFKAVICIMCFRLLKLKVELNLHEYFLAQILEFFGGAIEDESVLQEDNLPQD
jgi:hypothetical protein